MKPLTRTKTDELIRSQQEISAVMTFCASARRMRQVVKPERLAVIIEKLPFDDAEELARLGLIERVTGEGD
jgi:hypothetical protein